MGHRESQIKWIHCHHSMACLEVADGGDGLQVWRPARDLLEVPHENFTR